MSGKYKVNIDVGELASILAKNHYSRIHTEEELDELQKKYDSLREKVRELEAQNGKVNKKVSKRNEGLLKTVENLKKAVQVKEGEKLELQKWVNHLQQDQSLTLQKYMRLEDRVCSLSRSERDLICENVLLRDKLLFIEEALKKEYPAQEVATLKEWVKSLQSEIETLEKVNDALRTP